MGAGVVEGSLPVLVSILCAHPHFLLGEVPGGTNTGSTPQLCGQSVLTPQSLELTHSKYSVNTTQVLLLTNCLKSWRDQEGPFKQLAV